MQLSGVFGKSALADLRKSEAAFDCSETVSHLGPNVGFEPFNGFKDSDGLKLGWVAFSFRAAW